MARVRILLKPKRHNLILEDALWDRLIERARAEDRSLSSLTRLAIKEYLQRRNAQTLR